MGFVPGWFYPGMPEAGFVGETKYDYQLSNVSTYGTE